jgi:hypothetical protein
MASKDIDKSSSRAEGWLLREKEDGRTWRSLVALTATEASLAPATRLSSEAVREYLQWLEG